MSAPSIARAQSGNESARPQAETPGAGSDEADAMTYSTDDTKNPNNIGDDSPAQWWSARQLADEFESPYGGCVRDNLGLHAWKGVKEAFLALTGDAPSNLATYDELMIMPASVAEAEAGGSLTRAEVGAYADAHGLDDPHVIADRLAEEGSLHAEAHRCEVRELFQAGPLPLSVNKVPSFPVHALPPVLGDMAQAVADNLDVDVSLCAPMALGAISGALCGRVDVRVDDDRWIENGVSYTVIVGESGDYKSPAMAQMLTGPLHDAERELIDRWLAESIEDAPAPADDNSDGDTAGSDLAVVGDSKPIGAYPCLIASDITSEALAIKLAAQGERIMVADAEGDIFDTLAGRYSASPGITILLHAYTGETHYEDRVGRASIRLDRPAVTMCVATQPHVAQEALSNPRFVGKGLIARVEFAHPESVKERYRRGASSGQPPVPPSVRSDYTKRIADLVLSLHGEARRTAQLDNAAQLRMKQVVALYKARRYGDDGDLAGSPELETWVAKSAGRVARRALHLHMAEHGPKGADLLISAETVRRAAEIEEWYIVNAKQAFGVASIENADRRKPEVKIEDAKAMSAWLIRAHSADPFKPIRISKLTATGPKRLRQKTKRDAVLDLLVDLNHIVRTKDGGADAVYMNPDLAEV